MKTTIKTFVKKISFAFLVAAAFVLPSCKIGLGEALDLHGPTVAITAPEARENVKDKFTISGTVTDDFDIGKVTVTVKNEKKEVCAEWRNEQGRWAYRATSSGDYSDWGNATWELSDDGRSVKWTINDANPTGVGVFTITVAALDGAGNSSDESTKSRDVIIDATPPAITINTPKLVSDKSVLDLETYQDITKINMFITGDFTIVGNAKDDNTIKFVDLRLIDAENGKEYFAKRMDIDTDPTIDSLRAWEIPVKLDECGLGALDDKKHMLKVYTNTGDAAGNTNNDLVFQGYTCLWKEADVPWISFPELKGMDGTSDTKTKSVYSGSPLQGTAYDDAGISKVTVTIYKADGTTIVEEGAGENKVKYENYVLYDATGGDMDNNVPFNLKTPDACEKYKVVLTAYDNKGTKSEDIEGWIKVEDKTYPAIEVTYSNGKNTNMKGNKTGADTLFGDAAGDFTFNIRALDDTQVKAVRMVRIVNQEDVLNYSNAKFTDWSAIPPLTTLAATGGIDNEIVGVTRKEYKAYKQMNIFATGDDGLGIDGTAGKLLGNQTFVFHVVDNNGNASTRTFTIQGDVQAPKVEFTKIEYAQDGNFNNTANNNVRTYTKGDGETIPAFGVQTKVRVTGTISDDSGAAWGLNKAFKLGTADTTFTLTANDAPLKVTVNNNGTFNAEATDLRGASLIFNGKVGDYAGNESVAKFTFLVDTQNPKVEYISSTTPDGYYGTTKTDIDIYIRFNVGLKLTGTTGTPELTLNNGGKATLNTTKTPLNTETNEFHFTYDVSQSGTDSEKALAVTGVDLKGGTIKKASDDTNSGITATEILKATNLDDMKNIWIIINAPKLNSVVLNETTGVLTLTYSKNVVKGTGEVTITQQKNAGDDGIDKVPAVLSDSEYRTLYAKDSSDTGFKKYYESSTNGADSSFNADMTAKYVLKYEYDSNDSALINLFTKTGIEAHKLKQNIKSNRVTVSGKTITIKFDVNKDSNSCLPCKGAKYKIVVPEGFAYDANGGADFKAEGNASKSNDMQFKTAAGIETPVIRVSTQGTTVTYDSSKGKNDSFIATQPWKAEFKVDCETPGVELKCGYKEIIHKQRIVQPNGRWDGEDLRIDNDSTTTGTDKDSTAYTAKVYIGTDTVEGNEYKITATATKDGKTVSAYQKASRTVIQIDNAKSIVETKGNQNQRMNRKYATGWNGYRNIGLFIRGGDNVQGANSTQGLPLEWNTTKTTKTAMLTKDASKDSYYYATWNINVPKFYFAFIVGICDKLTVTSNGGEGPQCFCYGQNCAFSTYNKYPVAAGEYITLVNKSAGDESTNSEFCVHEAGKPVTVRAYTAVDGTDTEFAPPKPTDNYKISMDKDKWTTWSVNIDDHNDTKLEASVTGDWGGIRYYEEIDGGEVYKKMTMKINWSGTENLVIKINDKEITPPTAGSEQTLAIVFADNGIDPGNYLKIEIQGREQSKNHKFTISEILLTYN